MAYISYEKLWQLELEIIVLKKDKVQDININQLKLEVHDSYKEDEKLPTKSEPSDVTDVINGPYLEKKSKIEGQISYIEKDYNGSNLRKKNKQSVVDLLIERAVRTTIQFF